MILAIETSTGMMSAALFRGDELLDAHEERIGRGHAEKLVPMIEGLIGEHVPGRILVSVGPGSFTGIRVGIAAAQGLAIGWHVPLAGFSSFSVIAAAAANECEDDAMTVAMPGGHGEYFVQDFSRAPLVPLDEPRSLPPADAANEARDLVAGPGAEALAAAGDGRHRALVCDPLARHALDLPEPLRTLSPAPLYVRSPDAKPKAA